MGKEKMRCAVCMRVVDEGKYWGHIVARHPLTAAQSNINRVVVSNEEVHNFGEISRLAKLTH
jgi:hypothetical protein